MRRVVRGVFVLSYFRLMANQIVPCLGDDHALPALPCLARQKSSPPTVAGGLPEGLAEGAYFLGRSKRSRFITLVHAATKSCTNFSLPSAEA